MENPEQKEQFEPVISVLRSVTPEQADDICRLYAQLSLRGNTTTRENIDRVLNSPAVKLLGMKDKEKIIGVTLLFSEPTLRRLYVRLEDVVVDQEYRGRGLGEKLIRRAIEIAREDGADIVELSSVPERVEAGNLYEKVGFEQYVTRNYTLDLKKSEKAA